MSFGFHLTLFLSFEFFFQKFCKKFWKKLPKHCIFAHGFLFIVYSNHEADRVQFLQPLPSQRSLQLGPRTSMVTTSGCSVSSQAEKVTWRARPGCPSSNIPWQPATAEDFCFSNLYLIQGDQFFWGTNRKKSTHTMLWSWRISRGLHFWWRKQCLYMFLFGLCLKRSCTKVYLVHFLWIEPKEDVAMMKCTSCNSPSYQPMIFKEFLANAQGWRSVFFMVSP